MRMSEQNSLQLLDRHRDRDVLICVTALLHTAVDKDMVSVHLQQSAAACDLMGCSDKCDIHSLWSSFPAAYVIDHKQPHMVEENAVRLSDHCIYSR